MSNLIYLKDFANEKNKSQLLKNAIESLCSTLGVVYGDDLAELKGVETRVQDRLKQIKSETLKDAESLRNRLDSLLPIFFLLTFNLL